MDISESLSQNSKSLPFGFKSRTKLYALIIASLFWLYPIVNLAITQDGLNKNGVHVGLDFVQFYYGAMTLKSGKVENMYNGTYYDSLYEQMFGAKCLFELNNPCAPFHTLLYIPLTTLPYLGAYITWVMIGLFLFSMGIFILQPDNFKKNLWWSLSFIPVVICVMQGQNSFLTFFILAATYALWSKNKMLLSGLMLSMIAYKPYWAIGVLLLWILNPKKNAIALLGFVLGCITIIGISFIFLSEPTHAYFDFLSSHRIATGQMTVHWLSAEHTLFHAIYQTLPVLSAAQKHIVQLILCLIGLTIFFLVQKRIAGNPALQFAWAIILTFWLSPHTMRYELVLFIIPAILLWFSLPRDRPQLKKLFILLWLSSVLYLPLTVLQFNYLPFAIHLGVITMVYTTFCLAKIHNKTPSSTL